MSFLAGREVSFPVWLKLVRVGDQFTGYVADDGKDWRLVGSTAVSMHHGTCVDGGLAVTSHDVNAVNTSTFDNVSALSQAFADQDVGDVGRPWKRDGLRGRVPSDGRRRRDMGHG